jgi:hypothetical protein
MGRLMVTGSVLLALVLMVAATPVLAKPDKGCSGEASGWILAAVDREWRFGDGVPATGQDHLWDVTAAGTLAEFPTLLAFAQLLGLDSVEALYGFALEGWRGVDKNVSGAVCIKDGWNPPGQPEYIINLVDDNSASG